MAATITPEEREKRIEEAKENGARARQSGPRAIRPVVVPSSDFVHTLGCNIANLVEELALVKQEALAQGWDACVKETIYKGHYFKECEGGLHIKEPPANPHKDAAA